MPSRSFACVETIFAARARLYRADINCGRYECINRPREKGRQAARGSLRLAANHNRIANIVIVKSVAPISVPIDRPISSIVRCDIWSVNAIASGSSERYLLSRFDTRSWRRRLRSQSFLAIAIVVEQSNR